ncbi:MAG: hypothetical protein ACOC6O_02600 [Chloroflexota bacterium]
MRREMIAVVRITKDVAEKRLAGVSDDVVFRCHDGRILRNLRELRDALAGMENDVFVHHVGEGKNDFSTWVRDIIGDEKLANDLKKSPTREEAAKVVSSRITFLESKLASTQDTDTLTLDRAGVIL